LGYAYFLRAVRRLTGVDLSCYRQGQLRRRLEALVQRAGADGFSQYARLLEREPARLQEFRDYFTINVSEFFRDPPRFEYLQTQILPGLLAARPHLRVWSAGCSNGAEPYSVAMLLRELAPRGAHRVLATDVDRTVLERARRGDDYAAADLRQVAPDRLARHFAPAQDGKSYTVRPEVKALVQFREHDLLGPVPGEGFDLILCRNVVIYFTETAKTVLHERLVSVLRPGGVLFVGGTEIVREPDRVSLTIAGASFYRKDAAARRALRPA
jgi:chemotaxis protein methyltransferase CheR